MKAVFSPRKGHYMKRAGIFVLVVALVIGTMGCTTPIEEEPTHILSISSTAGGSVTTPGEGISVYDEGTSVSLVASPAIGYRFVNWTGDVGTVADVNAATTTITMEADYAITANFIEVPVYLDKIGPGLWGLGVWGQRVDASVTEEGVVAKISSDSVNDSQVNFGCSGDSLYTLEGDFDIRMGYELITWPQHSGIRVALIVLIGDRRTPDRRVAVARHGFGDPDLDFPGEPREVYLVSFDWEVHAIIGTGDLSGTLRVCREGERVTGYYGTSEGWREIYEGEWTTEDVYVAARAWGHEYLFGGEEVKVLLRTVEIVEP